MSRELEVACDAARRAGELVQRYQQDHDSLGIEYKGRHDLVTKADVASEELILSVIRRQYPDDAVLAEESTGDAALSAARTWIIDPIDGTTNFAHGFPLYCISIALYENRQPQMGMVYEVNQQEMFTAVRGRGAFCNGRPIRVSDITQPDEMLLGTGFPYRDLGLVDDYLRLFRLFMEETQGVRRPGTAAYDLCCVASGRFDGFYEYALAPWDVAAAALIILEAGGVVTDWTGGGHWLSGRRIIAGNPAVHTYLRDKIEEMIPESYRQAD